MNSPRSTLPVLSRNHRSALLSGDHFDCNSNYFAVILFRHLSKIAASGVMSRGFNGESA
jgi:hypothetical protein